MTERKRHIPHPAQLFLLLLVVLMLFSWIASILEQRNVSNNGELVIRSLLDPQGIRWFVRNSVTAIGDAPVGNALLLICTCAIASRSGLPTAICSMFQPAGLSYKEKIGSLLAVVVFLVGILSIIMGTVAGHHVLLGLDGSITSGPLREGFMLVLFLLLSLPCVLFGLATGIFRSTYDILAAVLDTAPLTTSYLIAVFVGAQMLTSFDYSGLGVMYGMGDTFIMVSRIIVYWGALLWVALIGKYANDSRKSQ